MTDLTPPISAAPRRGRAYKRRWDVMALTGALFVTGVVAAFVTAGNTPDGDASAQAVIAHYADNRTQGIIASVVLALTAVPALAFAARLRERARVAFGIDRTIPNLAFGAGVVTATGVLGAAAIHLALSDYARDLDPSAVQALNALDADSFLLFTTGIATLVLATSLVAIRSRLLPAWLGWVGIPVSIAMFTPVGFFAACVAGAWIIGASLILFTGGERSGEAAQDRMEPHHGSDEGETARTLTPTFGS
jgi:hypothetical protein